MEDRGTGEYVSTFSAIRAAAYRISVTLNGVNIAGSPFAAIVTPGEVSAATSYAVGEGLKTALCGQKARLSTLRPFLLQPVWLVLPYMFLDDVRALFA